MIAKKLRNAPKASGHLLTVLNRAQDSNERAFGKGKGRVFSSVEHDESTHRVTALTEDLVKIIGQIQRSFEAVQKGESQYESYIDEGGKELDSAWTRINKRLRLYVSEPILILRDIPPSIKTDGLDTIDFGHHMPGVLSPVSLHGEHEHPQIPLSERLAIEELIATVKNGQIHLLRTCTAPAKPKKKYGSIDPAVLCGVWFVAPRKDRKWCSQDCYRRIFGTSTINKEARTKRDMRYRYGISADKLTDKKYLKPNHPARKMSIAQRREGLAAYLRMVTDAKLE